MVRTINGITLEQAIKNRDNAIACYEALMSGQAQHYKIGTREYTAFDLDEIYDAIVRWSDYVDAFYTNARTNKAVRFVPRDL